MKDSWTCRDYRSGDEHAILALYREVNHKKMTLAHWMWKFTRNPFGLPTTKLMFDGDNLIGYYAVIPMNLQFQGKLVKAALSVNTMTHPSHERQGIFSYLAEEVYKQCYHEGLRLVYGFPNENSYYGFTNKLGWKGFGKMSALHKRVTNWEESTSTASNISEVASFDERANSLWARVGNSYPIIVTRTEEFLNWRFVEHPGVKYPKVIMEDGRNGLHGYMVLKIYTDEDEIKGHIVDILCVNQGEMVKELLRYAYGYFNARRITDISCWAPEGSLCATMLEEEGFARKPFPVNFGVRVLDKEDEALRAAEQMGSWHLAMCDLDVF